MFKVGARSFPPFLIASLEPPLLLLFFELVLAAYAFLAYDPPFLSDTPNLFIYGAGGLTILFKLVITLSFGAALISQLILLTPELILPALGEFILLIGLSFPFLSPYTGLPFLAPSFFYPY
jgi:hypothetical protein